MPVQWIGPQSLPWSGETALDAEYARVPAPVTCGAVGHPGSRSSPWPLRGVARGSGRTHEPWVTLFARCGTGRTWFARRRTGRDRAAGFS